MEEDRLTLVAEKLSRRRGEHLAGKQCSARWIAESIINGDLTERNRC